MHINESTVRSVSLHDLVWNDIYSVQKNVQRYLDMQHTHLIYTCNRTSVMQINTIHESPIDLASPGMK